MTYLQIIYRLAPLLRANRTDEPRLWSNVVLEWRGERGYFWHDC
jgi:hypothetical protein